METPRTLLEAARYFADRAVCEQYMKELRWHGGKPVCPACGSDQIGQISTRRMLRCKKCRKQFSHKVGTIFEDSPLGLDKWFVAVWAIANCKNGISSHELGRAIGVTQKTAWFMLHRIRKAMEIADDNDKFEGPCEADTCYVGGKAENMHKKIRAKRIQGRGSEGKTPIHGILERGDENEPSQIRVEIVGEEDAKALVGHIKRNVRLWADIYTDEATQYSNLVNNYAHEAIDHGIAYVKDQCHTNGCENFWSLFKRTIGGTYVAISPFHLFRYAVEQVFRFNYRGWTDGQRFRFVLSQVFGRRLTYRLLAGIDGAGFMGLE